MIKVSVIIATYCSGTGLDRVVRSLDRQTLPAEEFEVIFVDDGSPDDTYRRLEQLKAGRANVQTIRIPHSGWPSRPRNVGIEAARGEYLLFMDHDDELYPDALRAAFALGHANDADAVNGKETRTQLAGWAIDVFTGDLGNGIGLVMPHPLAPMDPHKLYRRTFLNEHHIRFPEGRRAIGEDIFFNVEVLRHARVISVLSETPFYHWVHTGKNSSSSYGRDVSEYWSYLERAFDFIAEQLSAARLDEIRQALLADHYKTRILAFFDDAFPDRPQAEVEVALGHIRSILNKHIPVHVDSTLGKSDAAKAVLLRAERIDLLRELCRVDAGLVGVSQGISADWRNGLLRVAATATWSGLRSPTPELAMHGNQLHRKLPQSVADALPPNLLDVTDEINQTTSQLAIRSRVDQASWMQETSSRVDTSTDALGNVTVTVASEMFLDIDSAIFAKPLKDPEWDIYARNRILGRLNQRFRLPRPGRSELPRQSDWHRPVVDGGHHALGGSNHRGRRRRCARTGVDKTRVTTLSARIRLRGAPKRVAHHGQLFGGRCSVLASLVIDVGVLLPE